MHLCGYENTLADGIKLRKRGPLFAIHPFGLMLGLIRWHFSRDLEEGSHAAVRSMNSKHEALKQELSHVLESEGQPREQSE